MAEVVEEDVDLTEADIPGAFLSEPMVTLLKHGCSGYTGVSNIEVPQ